MERYFTIRIARKYLPLIIIALLLLIAGVAYAIYQTWTATVRVNIVPAEIRVYKDIEGTSEVTEINFGAITQGEQTISYNPHIINKGTGAVKIFWNTTLSDLTNKMWDEWVIWGSGGSPWNGTRIEAGETISTSYQVHIKTDVPLGPYEWTLAIWCLETI